MSDHYLQTLDLFHSAASDAPLAFGHSAIIDIDEDKKTIRQMSIDLCGNEGLEDRIQRWVEAARWDTLIALDNGRLYEEARTWLTPSHFTCLYRYFIKTGDYQEAHEIMQQCFVRDVADSVTEVQPVRWLMGKTNIKGGKSFFARVVNYANHLFHDLILTPFDGLTSKAELDAAADVREKAKGLKESLDKLIEIRGKQ